MRPFFAAVVLCGCNNVLMVPEYLDHVDAGHYVGPVHFEAKARVGPIRVGKDGCDADMDLWIDPEATPVIYGTATCTLEEVGDVTVELSGDVTDLPYAAGTLQADEIDATWDGWFADTNVLHAESRGKVHQDGVSVAYEAILDVDLRDPDDLYGL
jgi:hypothetical protein